MPAYEYVNCAGMTTEVEQPDGTIEQMVLEEGQVIFEVDKPMSKADPVGKVVACSVPGFKGKMKRVSSLPNVIIKGENTFTWREGETIQTKTRDGQDIRFSFIDHKGTSPGHQQAMNQAAKKGGIRRSGMSGARYSEEHGRWVVDVHSNVEDPLGEIERAKRDGRYHTERADVKKPVRIRQAKGDSKPRRLKRSDIALPMKTRGGGRAA